MMTGLTPNQEACIRDSRRRAEAFDRCLVPEVPRLAALCREMARRFLEGGRLLAFGQGAAATDAQHISVEFVHPVIVGKRALPALDLGPTFETSLPVLITAADIVVGFAFPPPDAAVDEALDTARRAGGLTVGLSSEAAEYSFPLPGEDPFVSQEIAEVLYHLLWESVHVFFEHREQGHDVGASAFLYPFLGRGQQSLDEAEAAVRISMLRKIAELNALRDATFERHGSTLEAAARDLAVRLRGGGCFFLFGNGGSATDANDLAIDCIQPPPGMAPLRAISLSAEPANLTAVANDIGAEALYVRQLMAHARPGDIALALSTSGSSANLISGLAEARRLGLLTVALVGYDGGRIASEGLADHVLTVPSDHIPRIQEVQASLYHTLRLRLDALHGGGPDA